MLDDPADLERRAAYLEALRGQGRLARMAGLVACLVGVLVLVIGRYLLGGPSWALAGGVAVIALGWALFIFAVGRRLFWARTHPYSNSTGSHG